MNIRSFIAALILTAALFLAPPPHFSSAEVVDKIVVVVNNEIITQREIDIILSPIYAQYRTLYSGNELIRKLEEARENILRQLIEDRLILSEAKKQSITVEEKELDSKIDEVRKRVGSEKDLEDMLNEQNLTVKELRERYREKIMIRKLIDQRVGARIIITPLEVKNYYNANKDEFLQPEEVRLKQILIRPKQQGPDADKAALERMREIANRLKEGCDFDALAKEYSDGPGAAEGGLMGFVKKGDLMPQIEEVVFNLQDGQVTGIIKSSLGYHIFKVEERREKRMKELSEVRQDIEEYLYREKANQRLKGWIDSLAKNAYIEFK